MFSLHQAGTWGFDGNQRMHLEMITCHTRPMRRQFDLSGVVEAILGTRIVKIRIVYAYPPLAPFFRNYHHVSKPFRVFHFPDKPSLQKVIYLDLDDLMVVWVEAAYSLLNNFGRWEDIQLVGGFCGAYPYHARMNPGEQVSVSL